MKCERCGKTGSHRFIASEQHMTLCDRCRDRYEVQDAYEKALPKIVELTMAREYEAALAALEAMEESQIDRDHDGWLRSSVLSHRAMILELEGKWTEAVAVYREGTRTGFAEPSEYLTHQLALANLLVSSGKTTEAVTELERGLDAAERSSAATALSLLSLYSKIAHREGLNVPLKYRPLFEESVRQWGIPIPLDQLTDVSSLSAAIDAADSINRRAQDRYVVLQDQLRRLSEGSESKYGAVAILEAFIRREAVGLYRQMAEATLEDWRNR